MVINGDHVVVVHLFTRFFFSHFSWFLQVEVSGRFHTKEAEGHQPVGGTLPGFA